MMTAWVFLDYGGFNGAVASQPRKAGVPMFGVSSVGGASMGPWLRSHGRFRRLARAFR